MDLVPRSTNIPSATTGYRDQNAALIRELAPIGQITGRAVSPTLHKGDYLGLEVDPPMLERVTRQASFEFMKEHARQFVSERAARDVQARYGLPRGELWVQIRGGRTGDSRDELSAETIRQFNAVWKREIEGPLGFATYDDLRACLTSASRARFNRAPERGRPRV